MKQTLSMLLLAAMLATSCSKNNNETEEPAKQEPTVLLTKVTNLTPGDPDNGKVLASFTYNGKQLTKAVINHYSITPDVETDVFNYNPSGQLTGTSITHTRADSYNYVNSAIIYNGGDIAKITFYKSGNAVASDNTLTYQDGRLVMWYNPNEVEITYNYDSNGNNTKQVTKEYNSGKTTGSVYTANYLTFDNKTNLTKALPYWIYFRTGLQEDFLSYLPGANNVLTGNDDGTSVTYKYEYNSNGYPSKITTATGTYAYEYIEVK
ncbi:hypothetical protein KHS38_15300 [Mucilaginibacter sp. Bleaf8]|uniref:hypothetical protein n=1 Tax=Mucilaginibacter sp. Bleaf8 TaxID=2834430 RepID=UPI001BCDF5F1|nr:hypothetical protein [Mucilaginibacter sp. Bleaf8]MBS7565774.1 hypothetical protein [Mucilaginibacter sp. Bleaf8]